jgi:hypothetical protein
MMMIVVMVATTTVTVMMYICGESRLKMYRVSTFLHPGT